MALVQLHIYDVCAAGSERSNQGSYIRTLNSVGKELGLGGIFHGGVEVYDAEWSFGYCEQARGSGVYPCRPKHNPMYRFRESVTLGVTRHSRQQVQQQLRALQQAWQGAGYELLTRNCLHFCDAFCAKLGVPPCPAWLNRMAGSADTVVQFANNTYEQVQWLSAATAAWWNRSPSPTPHAARADSGHLGGSSSSAAEPTDVSLLAALPKVPIPPQWQRQAVNT